jgi:hypothetical protein
MAVGPAKGGLEHLVELGEVEANGKLESAGIQGSMPRIWTSTRTMKASGSNGSSMATHHALDK